MYIESKDKFFFSIDKVKSISKEEMKDWVKNFLNSLL